MPDRSVGPHMVGVLLKPDVMEFLDFVTLQSSNNNKFEDIPFSIVSGELKNKTLKD